MIAVWTVLVIAAGVFAPTGVSVWQDGEFAFLPQDSSSRRAERLFRDAFLGKEAEHPDQHGADGETAGVAPPEPEGGWDQPPLEAESSPAEA